MAVKRSSRSTRWGVRRPEPSLSLATSLLTLLGLSFLIRKMGLAPLPPGDVCEGVSAAQDWLLPLSPKEASSPSPQTTQSHVTPVSLSKQEHLLSIAAFWGQHSPNTSLHSGLHGGLIVWAPYGSL